MAELSQGSLLVISAGQVSALYETLRARLGESPCDDTTRWTAAWAVESGLPIERLLAGLRRFGGSCDCRVVIALRVLAPETRLPYALCF
jgi:hypothetical protein